jgi:hypothetical protein
MTRWRALLLLAAAELAGMSVWFGASSAAPALAARWGIAAADARRLTSRTRIPARAHAAVLPRVLLTTASIAPVGRLQHSVGWRSAFAVLAPGPALGVVAMLRAPVAPGGGEDRAGEKMTTWEQR